MVQGHFPIAKCGRFSFSQEWASSGVRVPGFRLKVEASVFTDGRGFETISCMDGADVYVHIYIHIDAAADVSAHDLFT